MKRGWTVVVLDDKTRCSGEVLLLLVSQWSRSCLNCLICRRSWCSSRGTWLNNEVNIQVVSCWIMTYGQLIDRNGYLSPERSLMPNMLNLVVLLLMADEGEMLWQKKWMPQNYKKDLTTRNPWWWEGTQAQTQKASLYWAMRKHSLSGCNVTAHCCWFKVLYNTFWWSLFTFYMVQ